MGWRESQGGGEIVGVAVEAVAGASLRRLISASSAFG